MLGSDRTWQPFNFDEKTDRLDRASVVPQIGQGSLSTQDYAYDETGNRMEEIQHALGGGQTVRSYTTPDQGPAHAVATVDEQGVGGTSVHSYDYDEAGNMVRRTTGEHDQTLEWGPEGELVRVTDGLERTEYVYDASGERLLRRANGATTLYLPGMEVTWDPAAGTEEATRYYTHAGATVAVRQDDRGLHWVFSDQHGTGQMTVDAVWSEVAQRRMTVFGQDRGATGEWPGERGFVDGTVDATMGLTQLGARAYDAALGRFISVDPLMGLVDGQQMHGYAYANNNPVSFTDPDGLILCQSSRDHDCAPLKNSKGKTVSHVYTGPNGFNSTRYAAGSAYGIGSTLIKVG